MKLRHTQSPCRAPPPKKRPYAHWIGEYDIQSTDPRTALHQRIASFALGARVCVGCLFCPSPSRPAVRWVLPQQKQQIAAVGSSLNKSSSLDRCIEFDLHRNASTNRIACTHIGGRVAFFDRFDRSIWVSFFNIYFVSILFSLDTFSASSLTPSLSLQSSRRP
jgi:hypothetical protein